MTYDDRIALLHALLLRVRSRARPGGPRTSRAEADAVARAPDAAATDALRGSDPGPALPAPPPAERPSAPSLRRPEAPSLSFAPRGTLPPPSPSSDVWLEDAVATMATPARFASPPPRDPRMHHAPPMEVIELDLEPDPTVPPPAAASNGAHDEGRLESRSRLVSASVAPREASDTGSFDPRDLDDPADTGSFDDEDGAAASDPTVEAPLRLSQATLDAFEEVLDEVERAPSSSRRPISMDEKMAEADDESPPLHTPPPASGRLPAASPSIDLSLEADPRPTPLSGGAAAIAREAIGALPTPDVEVAAFSGRTPEDPFPRTFGALLDAALSL